MESVVSGLIVIFGIIGAIWSLLIFGSADASRDETVARIGVAIGSILAILLVYINFLRRIPAEWDADKQARIETLEDEKNPRLFLAIGDGGIFKERDLYNDGGLSKTYLRVGVRNLSTSITIEDVEVVLANISDGGGTLLYSINKALTFIENGANSAILNPSDQKYLTYSTTRYFHQQKIQRFSFPGFEADLGGPGPYIVKLRVSGRNQRAQNFKFKIGMSEADVILETVI
jgi:hypothetical protein